MWLVEQKQLWQKQLWLERREILRNIYDGRVGHALLCCSRERQWRRSSSWT